MSPTRRPDPAACARRIRSLYRDDLTDAAGVLHVLAAWRAPATPTPDTDPLVVLDTGPTMPASRTDPFVLRVARARCDAILTTGRNLRHEPALDHSLLSQRADTRDVEAWRREVLDKPRPPDTIVLTRGTGIDFDHPVFHGPNRSFLFTTSAAAATIAARAARVQTTVIGVEEPGVRAAIDWLREERGARSVCIEAGPSTASQLYEEPIYVDELMLSLYEAAALDPASAGPPFRSMDTIERALPVVASSHEVLEPSGRWSYLRLIRRRQRSAPRQRP